MKNTPDSVKKTSTKPKMFDPSRDASRDVSRDAIMPATTETTSINSRDTMPKVSELTRRHVPTPMAKQPFQWQFLLPQYWGIWLALALFMPLIYLPLRWQFKIGKYLGLVIFKLVKRRRNDTLTNFRLIYPEKSEEERFEMSKMVFINAGVGLFESLCAWYRPDVFTRQVTVSGLQHVSEAQRQGKAVLLLGAHYTMLDLGGRLTSMFLPVDVVYRPQNNPLMEWFIFNSRTHVYQDQIDHDDMRKLAKNIKDGHIIWYSPDQDFGLKQGVMAPFFGVSAATLTAQRRLAKLGDKKNPPVLIMFHSYRETPVDMPKGRHPHYHLSFSPVIDNYPSTDEVADATRVNRLLENYLRIDPTQYMWFHRRFKTQPDGTKYYQ